MATPKITEYLGTGRRKTAVARVRLAAGSGKITVNGRAFETYFPLETQRSSAAQPLTITATNDKLDGTYRKLKVQVVAPDGGPLKVKDQKGKEQKIDVVARDGYTARHSVD